MKITTNWLKEHLDTKLNENQIIDKLTDVGLEVEGVDNQTGELDEFIIAKISSKRLKAIFNYSSHFKNVDLIFRRVFK